MEMLREFHTIDPDMLRACVAAFEDDILRIKCVCVRAHSTSEGRTSAIRPAVVCP